MRRLGILGGTFDPPHIGHLILGEYAADALGLEQVLYVPAADPPHKRDHDKSPAAERLAMLTLALTDNPTFPGLTGGYGPSGAALFGRYGGFVAVRTP
jgi:nicotinate-nucleotide adenylyltransferase